ncbi:MAG TPA: VOC family protein [Acidobacteriota bacterium]|nr:VOC family protein [Acidobacteriota bacterium]
MTRNLETLVCDFEKGKLSRRNFVATLTALMATAGAGAAAAPQDRPIKIAGLDHVAFRVSDVERSLKFYQDVLNASVRSQSSSSAFLTVGEDWIALFGQGSTTTGQSESDRVGVDHVSFDISSHGSLQERMEAIRSKGLEPINPAGSSRTYFRDPDGNVIQFS